MRIALFSDVHANLPALDAVLEDMDRRQPDAIFCLGDLVGYNRWPNAVIDRIRLRGIPTLAGNHDHGIGRHSTDCGCTYKTKEEAAAGILSIERTNQLVGDEQRRYLRTLPAQLRMRYQLTGDNLDLLLVHGSPRRNNEPLLEDRAEKRMLSMLTAARADILCCGHTHKPYHRVFPYERKGRTAYRHAINVGSVGKPGDGDTRACYVELTVHQDLSVFEPYALGVSIVRVAYDVERAVRGVREAELPVYYEEALRKGR